MKRDPEREAILDRLRNYASQWQMAVGTLEEQHKWVIDYAEKRTEESIKTVEYLDSKADSMMRYIGALITLIALTLTYAISKESPSENILFFLPVLMALLFSIWNALQCTRPMDQPRLPFIKEAFAYAQSPADSHLSFMRSCMELEYRTWLLGDKKGVYVETSLYSFLLALVWLTLGVLCVIFKAQLARVIEGSFLPLEYWVLVIGLLSVLGLYLFRLWKTARFPLSDWAKLFPETEKIVKSVEPKRADSYLIES
jgi:hypothetical protein